VILDVVPIIGNYLANIYDMYKCFHNISDILALFLYLFC